MNTEVALIFTVGGIVGSLLVTQIWQMNYFKKEQFKFKLWQTKKLDSLKLQKLKKDMDLQTKPKTQSIEGLDIPALIEKYLPQDEDGEDGEGWIGQAIGQIAQSNPELVQKVIGQVAGKTNKNPLEQEGVQFEE